MVPNRAQELLKISMYLNFPRSTCRFFRAIKEFNKHEDDIQVYNTGLLICSETQKWQSEAKETIVSIASNWGGSKTLDILTDLAEDNDVSDSESVDSELEYRSQPMSTPVQPNYTNTIIGQELARYETFTQQQWKSCKFYLIIYNIQITYFSVDSVFQAKQVNDKNNISRPLVFWETYSTQFPMLSKIGKMIFHVSSSSSALERTFSITSGHCTKDRNRIKAATLQAILQTSSEDTFIATLKKA